MRPRNCARTGTDGRRAGGATPAGSGASTGSPTSPSRLLGAPASQVSLLTDVQLVAAGAGLAARHGRLGGPARGVALHGDRRRPASPRRPRRPDDDRVRAPPAGELGRVGAYLGIPLTGHSGQVIGALCVFGPEPRAWSDADVATLRQLADSAVTELELSALVDEFEADRVRWGWRSTPPASAPSTGT